MTSDKKLKTEVTVRDLIKSFFPNGTDPKQTFTSQNAAPTEGKAPKPDWSTFPIWPPDVFAVSAYLARRSGAYQYTLYTNDYRESSSSNENTDPFEIHKKHRRHLQILGAGWAYNIPFLKYRGKHKRAKRSVYDAIKCYSWLKLKPEDFNDCVVEEFESRWHKLTTCNKVVFNADPGYIPPERDGDIPDWWATAIQLLIMSDQASKGLGFQPPAKIKPTKPQRTLRKELTESAKERYEKATGTKFSPKKTFKPKRYKVYTDRIQNLVSDRVDNSLVTVLPKSRTPRVGWTLRSMTHHLALLPTQGEARTIWTYNFKRPKPAVGRVLNLLLVPYPYKIPSRAFFTTRESTDKNNGRFGLRQLWLGGDIEKDLHLPYTDRDDLAAFVRSMIEAAVRDNLDVHGIVFPELSLNYEVFDEISEKIAKDYPKLEFIIAGLGDRIVQSQGAQPEKKIKQRGNFVAVRGILRDDSDTTGSPASDAASVRQAIDAVDWHYQSIRSKHHRWRLDPYQASRYAIRHRLQHERDSQKQECTFAADGAWWEDIMVGRRRVDVFLPREGTTLTTLICEDLARSDPCEQIIRAIGPNLVIALLLDGPQAPYRWPAHYAGVMAEDPGCSVLTLTSYGLVRRSSVTDNNSARSIAFWRDCRGQAQSLQLPIGAHGLILSLMGERTAEHTLDGRGDGNYAVYWRLAHTTPVSATNDIRMAREIWT